MTYEFGPYRYDADQKLLFREDEFLPFAPKAVETLDVLLNRRGRVVDKAELMKLVWPDTVVEEVGLARNVSLLRKALGDESETAAYIETIAKRGYRFVAEVRVTGASGGQPARPRRRGWWIAAAAAVAVVGFIYWQFYTPSRFLPHARVTASWP